MLRLSWHALKTPSFTPPSPLFQKAVRQDGHVEALPVGRAVFERLRLSCERCPANTNHRKNSKENEKQRKERETGSGKEGGGGGMPTQSESKSKKFDIAKQQQVTRGSKKTR